MLIGIAITLGVLALVGIVAAVVYVRWATRNLD